MKRSWPHAILVTAALLSSTSALADETPDGPLEPAAPVEELPEPRPQYVSQRRWGLFSIGAGVFGAAWVGNLLDTLNLGKYEGMIPVAGPFLLLDGKAATGTNVFHVLDGVAQAAGITLGILGVTLTRRVMVYALVPTASGFAIAGRF